MARIYSTAPAWTGTIGSGGVPDASITTIPLSSATGLTDGAYYILSIDRVDASGNRTPAKWEVVAGQLSGTNLINCQRGVEGTAQAHSVGATVEVLFTSHHWEQLKEYLENDYILEKKASGSDINTGTEDAKIVTPKAIADSNVVFTDKTQTITNKTFQKTIQTIVTATDGPTVTFDLSQGNIQKVTLGGNRTLAISNVSVGQAFIIRLTQDSTGSRTVTWWSGISWVDGSPPTLTTTPGKTDVFGFLCTGTNTYDGYIVGQNI